ncbi:SLOG family protein [Nonomuraea pusilla]|uniref:SLOG family protein n=1 Tax=Nonomuraea pusilla TaxID=46177 RepID=UPI00332C2895
MTYRILITGSRTWSDERTIWDALTGTIDQAASTGEHEFVVVHGHCPRGADAIADFYCEDQAGWRDNMSQVLAVERHPADWATCTAACPTTWHRHTGRGGFTFCPLAGHHRNQHMVNLGADILLAFVKGNSRGATDCVRRARAAGIPTMEWRA